MDGLRGAPIDAMVLLAGMSVLLSALGMPWLRRPASQARREALRTKWVYFDFEHPFLAAAMVWTLAVAAAVILVREAWIWGPALWRLNAVASLHGALAFVTGG